MSGHEKAQNKFSSFYIWSGAFGVGMKFRSSINVTGKNEKGLK